MRNFTLGIVVGAAFGVSLARIVYIEWDWRFVAVVILMGAMATISLLIYPFTKRGA